MNNFNTGQSFVFYDRQHLSELTGLKAATLIELVELIKTVSGSAIYYHTHKFLQQHRYLSPEPPNDFAYWVTDVLGEHLLGERLASIDIIKYPSIRELRDQITGIIDDHILSNKARDFRVAHPGEEFHFIKANSFIFPTKCIASNLEQMADCLKIVSIDSIYFHIFESRLRLEQKNNDIAMWIERTLGKTELAYRISRLDPYTYTLEDLRNTLITIISSG